MIRLRFTCVFLAAWGLGCAQPSADPDATGVGATGGRIAPQRSSGGDSGSGTGGAVAGSGGAVGSAGAGGGPSGAGSGGASGGPGAGDAAAAMDVPLPPVVVDAPAGASDAAASMSDGFRPIIPDAAPWQMMCPDGSARSDCCTLYCTCMTKFCPATIPTACVDACVTAKNWDLICRTYQCFASQNPNFPQDHDSHCKHAIGQLGKCGNR